MFYYRIYFIFTSWFLYIPLLHLIHSNKVLYFYLVLCFYKLINKIAYRWLFNYIINIFNGAYFTFPRSEKVLKLIGWFFWNQPIALKIKDVTYHLKHRICRVVTAVAMPCGCFVIDNFVLEYVVRKVFEMSLPLFTKEKFTRW